MGILNLTPDSFHDGGTVPHTEAAVARAEKMLSEGADILDLGGQSTRPGATKINADEEWKRVNEPLQAIRKQFPNAILSIDTFWADVAERAIGAGADLINDVSAGSIDENMFSTVAKLKVPYVLMHMQGTPQNMQKNPQYASAVAEILRDLSFKIAKLRTLGVNDLIIDPGFGFGKTQAHNYEILRSLEDFKILQVPLLVGVSRKKMISTALEVETKDALNGTTVVNAFALERGANILRVHDVKAAKELITLFQILQND